MYNRDCMELLESGREWDLAIVDPPYGIGAGNMQLGKGVGTDSRTWENKDWDYRSPTNKYFNQMFQVCKNQIIWGANYYENMKPTPCWVIWDKMQDFSGAVFEMAWTSFKSPAKAFRMSRVQAYANKNKIHPTQKPVKLYKWLLTNYAEEGDTILDTHGGSMSIAIACWDLGFDLDICELDEDYFSDAVKRFENHIAQKQLF